MAAPSANAMNSPTFNVDVSDETNELPTYDVIASENSILRSHCAVLTQKVYQLQEEMESLRKQINSCNVDSDSMPRKHARTAQRIDDTSSNSTNTINNDNNINNNSNNNNNNNNNFNNISNVGANRTNGKNMCVGNAASVDSSVNCSNSADNFTLVKKKKNKILQAINADIKSLNQHFKNNNFTNYTIKQNSITAPIKIAITDENDVPKIRDELIKSQISFHEFKWDAEKSKAFIIRGLVSAVDADLPYIKNELVAAGLPNNIILSLFKSGYMRANPNKEHNSLVQLILPPNSDTKILFDIKVLDHVAIKFEPLKNSRVLQCKNCQRLGHSAGGCQHPHRCVKCGKNHLKADCPRTADKMHKLFCCNCGGEHTANNITNCQYALNFISASTNKNTRINSSISNDNFNIINSSSSASSKGASNFSNQPGLNSVNKNVNSKVSYNTNTRLNSVNSTKTYAQALTGGSTLDTFQENRFPH